MNNSVKIRKIIFEILYEIHQKSINFDESYNNFTKKESLNTQEKSMVYNVVLNSIRNYFFIDNILNKFLKKRTSKKIKILLLSGISQILYLDFKKYAVTNDTVEVAKIKKLNPGLINAVLKKILINARSLNKKNISKNSIPLWLNKRLENNKLDFYTIIKNSSTEPSLHLVFKNKDYLLNFGEDYIETSLNSAFIIKKKKTIEINKFEDGQWWVQDFSSMLPIFLSPEIKSKKILDMCSAPGGKAFQAISLGADVTLNDINKNRIIKLKQNLKRLRFDRHVLNMNGLDISENQTFDVVIVDSPCSGIGTIRRNPEILYKKIPPNFDKLTDLQINLLNKASKLLNKGGVIIYLVCSFLNEETKNIKAKFLKQNRNFSQLRFKANKENHYKRFIDFDGDIYCIPGQYKNYMIDGFYGVKFIKND